MAQKEIFDIYIFFFQLANRNHLKTIGPLIFFLIFRASSDYINDIERPDLTAVDWTPETGFVTHTRKNIFPRPGAG